VSRIAVLGVSGGRVPPGTEPLLAGAAVVAGGRAVLALAPPGARRVELGAGIGDTLAGLAREPGPVCVLASGDPGFFGVVRELGEIAGPERLDVHPAPSSVSLALGCPGTTRWSCPPTAAIPGPPSTPRSPTRRWRC
jgi:precorrin-6Y C5,15-methyltransferase (decarboxylating)